eukprot:9482336-Karenia_brevis.AAC.1
MNVVTGNLFADDVMFLAMPSYGLAPPTPVAMDMSPAGPGNGFFCSRWLRPGGWRAGGVT